MKTTNRLHTGADKSLAAALLVIATLVLTACTNPMLATLEGVVTGYQRPTATISYATGSGLAADTPITVTFSETMNPFTAVIGGGLAGHADGGTWSEGSVSNDTLTIRPSSAWPAGSGQTLTVDAADLDTYELETLTVTYGVLEGVVYVHAANGSDSNPGTIDQPKRTISAGVSAAERVYDTAEVRVAGGTYLVTSATTISEDISLYGGYNPDNWAVRDPATYESAWLNVRTSGTHETVSYTPGVGASVVLDGFTITAGNGNTTSDATVAIFVSGASPTIQNNTIETGIAARAYGVSAVNSDFEVRNNTFLTNDLDAIVNCLHATNSTVTIADNTFTGEMITEFYGILLEGSDATIERNVINAGQPLSLAQGISVDGGNVTIRNNVITAGYMLTDSVIGQYGVYLNNCTATLQNNTIDGGSGLSADGIMTTGIMLFYQVNATIENNVIFTTGGDLRTGVWQVDAGSFPTAFNNNVMFACPQGNYYDQPGNQAYVSLVPGLADLETYLSSISATGNSFATVGLTAAPEYRPTAQTPPGKDLSATFNDDIEGSARLPMPWSTGAYEY